MMTDYLGPLELSVPVIDLKNYFSKTNTKIWCSDPGFQYLVKRITEQAAVVSGNYTYHRYQLTFESWHKEDSVVAQSTNDRLLDLNDEADVLTAAAMLAFMITAIEQKKWIMKESLDATPNVIFRFKDTRLASPSIVVVYCRFAGSIPRKWNFLCREIHTDPQHYINPVSNRPLVWYGLGMWLSTNAPQ